MLHLLVLDVIYFSVCKVRDYFNPDQGRSWNDKPWVQVLIPFLFSFVTKNSIMKNRLSLRSDK
jgi:hypothetical protein